MALKPASPSAAQQGLIAISAIVIAVLLVLIGFMVRIVTEPVVDSQIASVSPAEPVATTDSREIDADLLASLGLLTEMRDVLQKEFFNPDAVTDRALQAGALAGLIGATAAEFDVEQLASLAQVILDTSSDLTSDALVTEAINGLIDATDDRNTTYITPEEMRYSDENSDGNYEGIGATVDSDGDYVIIIAPFDGSPAAKAGIQPGDKILEINGEEAVGLTTQEAVDIIRGPAGTPVILRVEHTDGTIEDIEIIRGEIPLLTVTTTPPGADFIDRTGEAVQDIAFIRIARINPNTPDEVRTAVQEAESNGVKAIIFDVRRNPGGLLNETVEVTDMFLTNGVIYSAAYRDGSEVVEMARPSQITELPIVIIQDPYSASGAELFAAALKENNRAIVIGETSYGKGSVNNAFPLSNGGAIYTTIARWFTPDGNLIEEKGVAPDVQVKLTMEDFEAGTERYKLVWAAIDIARELAEQTSE